MRPRLHLRTLALVAAGVVLLAVAGWLLGGREGMQVGPPTERGAAPPDLADARSSGLEARPPLVPQAAREVSPPGREGAQPPLGAATPRRTVRVRGQVVGFAGAVPARTVARVLDGVGWAPRCLGAAPVGADGAFDLVVEVAPGESPWILRAEAWAPGFACVAAGFSGEDREARVRLEVPSGAGPRLEGRVVDDADRPARDLPLLVIDGLPVLDAPESWTAPVESDPATWGRVVARVATDGDGAFSVEGLWAEPHGADRGTLSIVAGAPSLVVVPATPGGSVAFASPPAAPWVLRALPSYEVTVRLVPEDPSDDPAAWGPTTLDLQPLGDAGQEGESWAGPTAAPVRVVVLRGAVPRAASELAWALRAQVHAHRPAARDARVGPPSWRAVVEVPIARWRPEELSRLTLASPFVDEAGRAVALRLETEQGLAGGASTLLPLGEVPTTEGSWEVSLAPGTVRLVASPLSPFGSTVRGRLEAALAPGQSHRGDLRWSAWGRVRLRLKPAPPPDGTWRFVLTDERGSFPVEDEIEVVAGEAYLPALGVGTWVLSAGDGSATRQARFRVLPDAETVVDLPAER